MTLYQCDCGFGSQNGATDTSITRHLKGNHDYDVNAVSSGWFYSNTCDGKGYSGRRFGSFEDLLNHLENKHDIFCVSQLDCTSQSDCSDYTTGLRKCECGFGSSTGASEEDFIRHIKGNHYLDVNVSSSGLFYCNECDGKGYSGQRFRSFEDIMEHLEDVHGFDQASQFMG